MTTPTERVPLAEKATRGGGGRGLAIAAGIAVLVAAAGGWFLMNRDAAGPVETTDAGEGLTIAPQAPSEDALVGMPVSETSTPETPEGTDVAPSASDAPVVRTTAPAPTPAAAARDTTLARQTPPAAQPPAPRPLDIAVDGALTTPPPATAPSVPVATPDLQPFLRGDAPISTAEPPLVRPAPAEDQR